MSDSATVLASEAATNAFVQSALHTSNVSATVATAGIMDSAQSFQLAAYTITGITRTRRSSA
jgi:hypothetical protein